MVRGWCGDGEAWGNIGETRVKKRRRSVVSVIVHRGSNPEQKVRVEAIYQGCKQALRGLNPEQKVQVEAKRSKRTQL